MQEFSVYCRHFDQHVLNVFVVNCADSSCESFDASLSRSLVSVYDVSSSVFISIDLLCVTVTYWFIIGTWNQMAVELVQEIGKRITKSCH